MAFNFGSWLEEAFANANPFDGGKTASTVVAARKRKAAPAVTPAQNSTNRVGTTNTLASPKQVQLNMPKISSVSTTKLMSRDEQRKKNLAEIDTIQKKAQADIWNPEKIAQDVGKAAGDVGNAVGQFFGGNTAKLVNTANAGVVTPIAELVQGKSPEQVQQNINKNLYTNKGGVFNSGTFFPTKEKYNETFKNPVNFAKGFTGAGVSTAAEVAPMARGASLLAKKGLTTTQKVVRGGLEGGFYGGAATAGAQAVNQEDFNPLDIVRGAAVGTVLGGGIPLAGAGAMKAVNVTQKGAQVASNTADELSRTVVRKKASQHPAVLGHDPQYYDQQLAYDNATDPVVKRAIAKAMAENRAARLQTQRQIESKMLQGGYINADWSKSRTDIQNNLAKALDEKNYSTDVNFGGLAPDKLKAANDILVSKGLDPIVDNNLKLHPNVLKKLREKRIDAEGMTPEQVADLAYSAIHNSRSKVLDATGKSNSIRLVNTRKTDKANNAFVGQFDGTGSIKSVYRSKDNLGTSEGRSLPSSDSPQGGTFRQSERFSDVQSANKTIPKNSENVNVTAMSIGKRTTGDVNTPKDISKEKSAQRAVVSGKTPETALEAGRTQNLSSPSDGNYTTKPVINTANKDPFAIVDELFGKKPEPKQRLTKAERQEVDAIIHEQDPNLLYRTSKFDTAKLTESGDSKLPRIHVNDLKWYYGNTENIPAKYKRKTGREDLDLLAQRAGYDDVDTFMKDFTKELDNRKQLRADTQLLKEFRNDPDTINTARERIAARKAAEPKTIKVKGSQRDKNVPVTQVQRTGDVVTKSNVNPNVKSKTEKRFSVASDGELIPDKKGATSVFTDKDGKVTNIRIGDKVYGKEEFGDLSDVNGYGSTLATMRRNVERGFGKETGDKLGRFLVDHQQGQATKMVERKISLNDGLKKVAGELGINFKSGTKNAKKVSAAIQDYGEGVRDKASLVDEFGQEQANKIVAADKWFRKQYDSLLNEANKTLKQYGYDPIPKRKNYYTHFQDESVWKNFGLHMDNVRRTLGDPTMQDAMPDGTRGKIDNKLAGQSEFTQPSKRFNPFAQQRKGNKHTADAFQAFERYMEPTLNNIYMTPSISRARVISRAIAQDANVAGKDANALLIQMKEWANDLAGKSNRFDRPFVDSNWGSKALKVSQWMQKKSGQNTIVGNLSTAVMQPIMLAQTTGKFGFKNTALGMLQAAGKDSVAMRQSEFLKRRYADLRSVTESKMDAARHTANVPLEVIEETSTKATWNAAYLDAKARGLSGKEAIRQADIGTEKTVAGRSIGEKPEIFRSKAAGFMTQYQLEVSNYWQQLGKEMTKKQALKVFVAAYGINSLLQVTTGRRVGFDPISAAIDMYEESQKEEKSTPDKLKSAGQRAIGEVADNLPFVPMIASTIMGQKNYQKLLGPESQGGRFGVSSPISTVVANPLYLASPFGGAQVKKTVSGAIALNNGKMTDKNGKTTVDIPKTPANVARGLMFGPSAIPEVNQYYNNIGKSKVDQKPVDNQIGSVAGTQSLKGFTLAQQKDLQSVSGPARDTVAAKFLAENEARRAEDAKKKTMTSEQKKSYSSDKRIDRYIADNVSKDTTSTLTKYYSMKPKDRETWFAKENDAEYRYWQAKYENDKANGKVSKIEEIKWQYNLKKDKVGSKYSKDTRDLYSLAKYKIADYLGTSKDGKKLANELLAYDKALYDSGVTKYLKFRNGFASSSGGSRGGSRGGKRSGGRKAAKKFTYALNEFAPKKSTSKNKQLYDLLKQARKKYS